MIDQPPPEPVAATSLADEIAFRLQAGILDGTYPPGTHLFQDELCARFGVSRTPVREALRKLQAQHLVVVVPNRGAKVRVPSREELVDVYAVRAELEGFACELAAGRAGAATLAALDAAQEVLDDAIEELEDDPDAVDAAFHARFTRGNEVFHRTIHDSAGNLRLRRIIDELQSFFPKDVVWRAMRSSAELHEVNRAEHVRIRDALAAGDGAAARREMVHHIFHARALLLAYLDEHAFWG